MKFSETCMIVPSTWTLDADTLRSALNWWAHVYKLGTRITMLDGQFVFTRSMLTWQRLETFGKFGEFPKPAPVELPDHFQPDLDKHMPALRLFLQQPAPDRYVPYFYHLLNKDYELEPIEDSAHQTLENLLGIGCDGGYFLVYYGRRSMSPEQKVRRNLDNRPPILARYGPLTFA